MPLPKELRNLPPGAYRGLGNYHADLARLFHAHADDYENGTGLWAGLQQAVGSSRGLADMVHEYSVNGMSMTNAYEAVRQLTGETLENVKWAYAAKYRPKQKAKAERDRAKVLKWKTAGYDAPAIAKITELPIGFVTRTLAA